MSPKIKHLAVYAFIIAFGFICAYVFLPEKTGDAVLHNDPVLKKDSLVLASLLTESYDLENNTEAFVSSDKSFSGKKSCKLSPAMEYGVSVIRFIKDIPSFKNLRSVTVTYKCFFEKDPDALIVLAVDDAAGKNIFWKGVPLNADKANQWSDAEADFMIDSSLLRPDHRITIYPWNRNKKEFYVDDLKVDFKGFVIYQDLSKVQNSITNLFFDLENTKDLSGTDDIKETIAHSGKKACDLSGGKEFGPTVSKKIREITPGVPGKISMSVWIYPLTDAPNTVLTASVANSKNETVFWDGESTENKPFPKNKWTKMNTSFFLPADKIGPEDILSVNVWNKGKTPVIIDDLEIVYGNPPERRGVPSDMDAKSIYDKKFIPEKNKPPFKTIWLEKQDIKNDDGVSITPFSKQDITNHFSPGDEFLVADFFPDKNNLEEIFCIKARSQGLFSYSPEKKQFIKLWDNTNSGDSIFNGNNSFYPVNYNHDNKTDLLLVNKKNGDWGVVTFTGKQNTGWTVLGKGTKKDKKPVTIPVNTIHTENEIRYSGSFSSDKIQFLILNTEWRFDLKLVQDNVILGNVDFKGYPADHNPKYYEFVQLVSGHFMNSKRNCLLVIMANCADNDFNGSKCNTVEELPYLPNSTQLYSFPE